MRKGRRKFVSLTLYVLLFLTILLFAYFYIQNSLLPNKIRPILIETLTKATQRETTISDISFIPFKGIEIRDLRIYEKNQKTVFIQIDKINFYCFLLPIIKDKTIVIPTLHIYKPYIKLSQEPNTNEWNFSKKDLDNLVNSTSKGEYTPIVYKIKIHGGDISIKKFIKAREHDVNIENLIATIWLASINRIGFLASANVVQKNIPMRIGFDGYYNIKNKRLVTDIKAKDLYLNDINYLFDEKNTMKIKRGFSDFTLRLDYIIGRFLALKGYAQFINTRFLYDNTYTINFDGRTEFNYSYDMVKNNPDYRVNLIIKKAEVEGLEYIKNIKNIDGTAQIKPDYIETDDIRCSVLEVPVNIKATLANFKKQQLKLTAKCDFKVSNVLKKLFADEMQNINKTCDFDADAKVVLTLDDTLTDQNKANSKLSLSLTNGFVKSPTLLKNSIENISGDLSIENFSKISANLKSRYQNEWYMALVKSDDINTSDITLDINSDNKNLIIHTNVQKDKETINIKDCLLNYKKLSLKLAGQIENSESPIVNLQGDFLINIEDLPEIFPKFLAEKTEMFYKNCAPTGRIEGNFFASGDIKKPLFLNAGITCKSQIIKLGGFSITDVSLGFNLKEMSGSLYDFKFLLYDGECYITSLADFSQGNYPYTLSAKISSVKIERLLEDTKIKGGGIQGLLNAELAINGSLKDPLKTMKGNGKIDAIEANLGPLPIFIPVVNNLVDIIQNFIPQYKKIILKEAAGTFTIANERVRTEDFTILSDKASIHYNGSIGFDGTLDFLIRNNFVEGLLSDRVSKLGKFFGAVANIAGRIIGETRLVGTIKNPKYEFKPLKFF